MPTTIPPKVLPGDEIEMDVPSLPLPKARLLPGGHYNFRVDSVRPAGSKGLILQLSHPVNLKSRHHVQFIIYPNSPLGWGWGYLGTDVHPVQFQLIQNLSQRIKAAVSSLEKASV